MPICKLCVSKHDNILIIAPHPDDESIGAGGLLLHYPNQCTVVVATDGGKADPQIEDEQMKQIRKREFASAMSIAGVKDCRMLDYPDGELNLYSNAFQEIEFGQYAMVFVPYEGETHPDHLNTFLFVEECVCKLDGKKPIIYQYETRSPVDMADHYLDISDCIQKKIEMIHCYESQIKLFDHAALAESINHYHACRSGKSKGHYEAYVRYDTGKGTQNIHTQEAKKLTRYKMENDLYRRWITLKNHGKSISEYLRAGGLFVASVYGYGRIGKDLLCELINDSYEVLFVLDQAADEIEDCIVNVFRPDYWSDKVDVVIVTPLFDHEIIKNELMKIGYEKVLSFQELINEIEAEKS